VKPVAIYPTEIFISHSHEDADLAHQLRKDLASVDLQALRTASGLPPGLEEDQFRVWAFERDLAFSAHLKQSVKDKIRDCDVFMIILSSKSVASKWVQMELGLAVAQSGKAKMRHPMIVAVLAESCVPMTMALRDFDSGALTGSFDFNATRCFAPGSPSTDAFDHLVQCLLLNVYCFGTDSTDPDLIPSGPDGAFACYEDLFPIREERDQPRDIASWLKRAYLRDSRATFCRLFLTLQMQKVCIGMAFLDLDRTSRWIFGAYFGIRAEWRGDERARQFLLAVTTQCQKVVPGARGIAFEVEPYDDVLVRSVLRKFQREAARFPAKAGATRARLTKAEAATIRAIKRINLYMHQRSGALAVTFDDRRPVSYIQPAMSEPLVPAAEVPLWLMVYPIEILAGAPGAPHIKLLLDIRDLLDFLYDVMFSEAYIRDPDTALDGFEAHVREVKHRVLESIGDRPVFLVNSSMLSRDARELLARWGHRIRELGIKL
jgi:hypothetical protein